MSLSYTEYLRHILAEMDYLLRHSDGLTQERFLADETLQRAFVRSLEIIGEATRQLPNGFRAEYENIDWRAMAGMRDVLIHRYFGVNLQIVWDVITAEIPALYPNLLAILQAELTSAKGDEK